VECSIVLVLVGRVVRSAHVLWHRGVCFTLAAGRIVISLLYEYFAGDEYSFLTFSLYYTALCPRALINFPEFIHLTDSLKTF